MIRKAIPRKLIVRLVITRGVMCKNCRLEKFSEINHIDKDPSNNDWDNLELLCLQCHHDFHHDPHPYNIGGAITDILRCKYGDKYFPTDKFGNTLKKK